MRSLILLAALLALAAPARAELVQVPSRTGVTVPVWIDKPTKGGAAAWVLLYVGGTGDLQLDGGGPPSSGLGTIYIIGSRQHLREAGLGVVVVDAPSDRRNEGMKPMYRRSPEHLQDVGAVVAEIRRRLGRPVWLFGHSNGGITAAVAARGLKADQRPDGLILSSATTIRSRGKPDSPLPAIPYGGAVLIVAHQQDACSYSPFSDSQALMAAFPQAQPKTLLSFNGPAPTSGDPCGGKSTHSFYGEEAAVMQAIARFVLKPH